MKSASDAQFDAAASDGRLTADQVSQRKVQAQQRIDQLMTQASPLSGQPQTRQRGSGSGGTPPTPEP